MIPFLLLSVFCLFVCFFCPFQCYRECSAVPWCQDTVLDTLCWGVMDKLAAGGKNTWTAEFALASHLFWGQITFYWKDWRSCFPTLACNTELILLCDQHKILYWTFLSFIGIFVCFLQQQEWLLMGVFIVLNSILDFYLFFLPRIVIDKTDFSAVFLFHACFVAWWVISSTHTVLDFFLYFHSPFLALFDFSKLFLSPLIILLVSKFIILMI